MVVDYYVSGVGDVMLLGLVFVVGYCLVVGCFWCW